MFKLVFHSVFSKRIFCQAVFGDALVQVQQNTQTCLCDEGMSGRGLGIPMKHFRVSSTSVDMSIMFICI